MNKLCEEKYKFLTLLNIIWFHPLNFYQLPSVLHNDGAVPKFHVYQKKPLKYKKPIFPRFFCSISVRRSDFQSFASYEMRIFLGWCESRTQQTGGVR